MKFRLSILIGFIAFAISINAQTLTAVKNGLVDRHNPCSICAGEDELFTGLLIQRNGLTRKIYAPFKVKISQDTIFNLLDPYGNSVSLATGAVTNYGTPDSLTNLLKLVNSSPNVQEVYKGFLSFAGTSAPSPTVLENSLDTLITWARSNTGIYTGTLTGAFTANKTFLQTGTKTMIPVYSTLGTIAGYYNIVRTSANVITITSANTSAVATDLASLAGATTSIPIFIEVYP